MGGAKTAKRNHATNSASNVIGLVLQDTQSTNRPRVCLETRLSRHKLAKLVSTLCNHQTATVQSCRHYCVPTSKVARKFVRDTHGPTSSNLHIFYYSFAYFPALQFFDNVQQRANRRTIAFK